MEAVALLTDTTRAEANLLEREHELGELDASLALASVTPWWWAAGWRARLLGALVGYASASGNA